MSDSLHSRTANLLIIEPMQSRRSMLLDGFKELGFRQVHGSASVKDAFHYLESEATTVDWIVTSIQSQEEPSHNAAHLLALTLREKRFQQTLVSFIVEPSQQDLLVSAFEMGLFSWHPKADDMMSQMASFANLLVTHETYNWHPTLTAAHYLRDLLKQQRRIDDIARLDRTLATMFPDDAGTKLHLAETLHLQGKSSQALRVLAGGVAQDKRWKKEAEELTRHILNATQPNSTSQADEALNLADTCGITEALIIDPDEAMQNLIRNTLQEWGVPSIQAVSNGEDAWNLISSGKKPDLIIQEWRIPKITGPHLLQRLRNADEKLGLQNVPVIVFSSLLKNTDRFALREMGVAEVIEKPQTQKKLGALLYAVLKEEVQPQSQRTFERQIRQAIQGHNLTSARELYEQMTLESSPNNPLSDSVKQRYEAEFAFLEGRLREANELAIQALHGGGEDIFLLNLLGKIYLKLRQYQQATQFFNKAQELSPTNVERLCNLAEAQLALDQPAAAVEVLEQARKIDAEATAVKETEIKIAVMDGDVSATKMLMTNLGDSSGVIAFLNNKGVMLVEQERFTESLELYKKALKTIPNNQLNARYLVRYNMGLALIKAGNVVAAIKCLESAIGDEKTQLGKKAKSLLKKAQESLDSGKPVVLTRDNKEEGLIPTYSKPASSSNIATSGERGELRCHLVFTSSQGLHPIYQQLQSKIPRFTTRNSIKKGEHSQKRSKA